MLKHWIWLAQRKGIGHVGCKKLLEALHSAEEIYDMTAEQYATLSLKGMKSQWITSLADKDLKDAETVIHDCNRYGIQVITYNDSLYPQRLKDIYDPPCVLYCKGTMPEIDQEAVIGVVGTRRCTNYGLLLTKQMSSMISLSGGIVVSGGARGIDTMALYGALSAYMPVVCVLAGGLDRYYPSENRKLFEDITRQGCLLSELPPGTPPVPKYFVARNRLISGLSLGVLVIEAPEKSGALTTAELALSQNRDVFTLQRKDSGHYNRGNQALIDSGCQVVRDGWELLARYAPQFPDRLRDGRGREAMMLQCQKQYGKNFYFRSPQVVIGSPDSEKLEEILPLPKELSESMVRTISKPKTQKKQKEPDVFEDIPEDLPESERKILTVLGKNAMELDEIIMKSGMEAMTVTTALTMLQIKKRIIKSFGNSYQRI